MDALLKLIKKMFLKKLNYMGKCIDLFLFMRNAGRKVTEVIVNHFPRVHGESNMDYLGY